MRDLTAYARHRCVMLGGGRPRRYDRAELPCAGAVSSLGQMRRTGRIGRRNPAGTGRTAPERGSPASTRRPRTRSPRPRRAVPRPPRAAALLLARDRAPELLDAARVELATVPARVLAALRELTWRHEGRHKLAVTVLAGSSLIGEPPLLEGYPGELEVCSDCYSKTYNAWQPGVVTNGSPV